MDSHTNHNILRRFDRRIHRHGRTEGIVTPQGADVQGTVNHNRYDKKSVRLTVRKVRVHLKGGKRVPQKGK